jgi:hypothetical protein
LSIKVLAINPTSVLAPICERNKSKCLNDGFFTWKGEQEMIFR